MQTPAQDRKRIVQAALLAGAVFAAVGFQIGPVAALVGFLVAAPAAAVVAYLSLQESRKRHAAFLAVAQRHGWTLEANVRDGPGGTLKHYAPSRRGHSQRAHFVLAGQADGIAFMVLDAEYVTGSGKSRQSHRLSAVLVDLPVSLTMSIERETGGHKLFDALGGEDLDVEDDEFSRQFWVRCNDGQRRTAYGVLHPKAIEFLKQAGTDWTWDWRGMRCMMSRPGRLAPENAPGLAAQAVAFARLVPRHLIAQQRPPAPGLLSPPR